MANGSPTPIKRKAASPRRHKDDTRYFAELTQREQVRSLNAALSYLSRAIQAHLRAVPHKSARRRQVLAAQIERLLERVKGAGREAEKEAEKRRLKRVWLCSVW